VPAPATPGLAGPRLKVTRALAGCSPRHPPGPGPPGRVSGVRSGTAGTAPWGRLVKPESTPSLSFGRDAPPTRRRNVHAPDRARSVRLAGINKVAKNAPKMIGLGGVVSRFGPLRWAMVSGPVH
jgi:hypothetical protein